MNSAKLLKALTGILLLVAGCFLGPLRAFAGSIEYNTYVDWPNMAANTQYVLVDPTYQDEANNPADYRAMRENHVRLVYHRDQLSDVDGNKWRLEVTYTISFIGQNLAPVQDKLILEHGTGTHRYAEAKVYTPGAHTILVTINSIQTTGPSPVPDDVRLELATVTERYQQLDINSPTQPQFNESLSELQWSYIPGAESYDVEWVWTDDKAVSTGADPFERAIRVNVTNQYYRPSLTYRAGEVHFRYRAVGRFIDGVGTDYSHKRYGAWSAPYVLTLNDDVPIDDDRFEGNMNLTYTTTYAEEGKFKKVMTYVDGAGKTRQTQTHLNSDSSTVATQTEFDYEGRPAITTIPIPIPGIDLRFRDLLNQSGANVRYNKTDFDDDHSSIATPMAPLSGAAAYFSPNNAFSTLHKDYIPKANGYPFTQVEYKRDATGRVSRQGGVGIDHQLGSGHETKFFYCNANATELHQMFGGNVGDASHYLLKMSVDPNGQVSFAWQDQEERVIATAMAGDSPANLVELDGISQQQRVDDLQSRTEDGDDDVVNFLDYSFPNEMLNKRYQFDWDLGGVADEIGCNVCYSCAYTLEISITDPDGELVTFTGTSTMPDGSQPAINTNHLLLELEGNNMNCPAYSFPASIDFEFYAQKVGSYRLVKNLRVREPDETAILAALKDNCPEFPNWDTLYQHAYDSLRPLCEEEDCEMEVPYFEDIRNQNTPLGYSTIPCNGAFTLTAQQIEEGACAGILIRLIADYAPGGWLHDPQVWSTLTTQTAIETYVLANHREACHYTACLEDARSKVWDIQVAASPGIGFAQLHHLIPPSNLDSDFWDPWFINNISYGLIGPGAGYRQDMLDLLWDTSPGYRNSGMGMIDYFGPSSNVPLVQSTYLSQCGGSTNVSACQDALHMQLLAGAYVQAKTDFFLELMDDPQGRDCHFFNDAHAVMQRPQVPVQAVGNIGAYNSALVASECNITCSANADTWMLQITTTCTLTSQQQESLRAALMDYCLGTCQDGNPAGLLTDTYFNAGALSAAQNIVVAAGCSTAITDLLEPDPYIYDDGNGTVYEGPCNVWDPGFIALLDLFNGNWSQPLNTILGFAGNTVLEHEFPGATGIDVLNAGLQLQSGSPCMAVELIDVNNGNVIPATNVKMVRYPAYLATTNLSSPNSYNFLQAQVEVVLHVPVNGESILTAHVFSGCLSNVVSAPGTCAYPLMEIDTAWTPTVYATGCDQWVVAQATFLATLAYEQQSSLLLNQALDEARALCRTMPPVFESFTMTHEPKVYQYTLYYYDQAGNLIQTVPPEGVELLDEATAHLWDDGMANWSTDMPQHRMRTTYAFNSLQQMRKSNTPDGGEKRIFYNSKDQVRLSQDARQYTNGDWAYVKYDELGRTVESGLCEGCQNISAVTLDDNSFPDRGTQALSDIVTTHYDLPYDPTFSAENLRTRVAAVNREDAEGDYVTTHVYDYDDHGNVKKMRTYLVGFGNFELHYEYDLISGKVNRANYQPGRKDYFAHRYTYDADNRLTKVETTRDNVFWDRDARYFYYPHGPLARMEIGQDNVQGSDHYYSIHGWIKGVNMPETLSPNGLSDPGLDGEITTSNNQDKWVGRDAFAFQLNFYQGDYSPIGVVNFGTTTNIWLSSVPNDILGPSGTKGLYNGNIPLMVTDLKKPGITGSFIGGPVANAYQYDQLNRLKQMRSYHRGVAGWTKTSDGNGYWDSQYGYDRNGNLESLMRRRPDLGVFPGVTEIYDGFTYNYPLTGGKKTHNRLEWVDDAASTNNIGTDLHDQSPGNYQYDAIGNIVSDVSEYIANIRWDLHGKVREVTRATNPNNLSNLAFWYDGTGNRVHKRVTTPGAAGGPDIVRDEWYVRDPQGNEMAVYERYEDNGYVVTNLKEHSIYGSDRLGLDLNGVEVSRLPIGDEGMEDPTGDPSGRHALVIGEIMYDSPTTDDDFPAGKEYSEGEYIVLINKSGITLDLSDYTLRLGADSLSLGDSLAPTDFLLAGERVIIGFGADNVQFQRITAMPEAFMGAVRLQNAFGLPDRGGVLRVMHASGNEVDALPYGEFYGLSAGNAYISDSLMDSLAMRNPLYSVSRESYGGAAEGSVGGSVSEESGVDISDPGVEPEPSGKAAVGSYTLWRGRKVYELKNHIGNVLAVVSDVKIGFSTANFQPAPVDYYTADVVEMADYEPFGMLLSKRHWVSGEGYRFGFQAQEGDDEWNGEGNMLAFKYRVHDARLGRFLSLDPLAPKYPWNSPYAFAENKVIQFVELEGLEATLPLPFLQKIRVANTTDILGNQSQTVFFKEYTATQTPYSWYEIWKATRQLHVRGTINPAPVILPALEEIADDAYVTVQALNPFDQDCRHLNGEEALPIEQQGAFCRTSFNLILVGQGIGVGAVEAIGSDGLPQKMPKVAYRGSVRWQTESVIKDLTLRPGEEALSFRDCFSESIGRPQVFRSDTYFIAVDTDLLPEGSVILDGGLSDGKGGRLPFGHISIKATPEAIQKAIIYNSKLRPDLASPKSIEYVPSGKISKF